jgi:hypothetical protein
MVGSLLDAHPQTAIAHELDALKLVQEGYSRWQLFQAVVTNTDRMRRRSRIQTGYDYSVPGQWQGRWTTLRVIGDKKGGRTTARLGEDPALFARLKATVGLPVKSVLIVRNPFDNIATMADHDPRDGLTPAGMDPLDAAVARYAELSAQVGRFLAEVPAADVFHARHEDFITGPQDTLRDLCAFLGLDAPDDYLRDCAGLVFKSTSRSRDKWTWSPEQVAAVDAVIARHRFLAGYAF